MREKLQQQHRRAKRTRMHVKKLQEREPGLARVSIIKTPRHISAQVTMLNALERETYVVASVSTQEAEIKKQCKYTGNVDAAKIAGKALAERLLKLKDKFTKIAFDRSGCKYHGRLKAFADAAREGGLDF